MPMRIRRHWTHRQRQTATNAVKADPVQRLTDGELLAAQYRSLAATFDEGAAALFAAADALRTLAPALEQAHTRTLADVPPDVLTAARAALSRVKDTQARIGVASLTTFNR